MKRVCVLLLLAASLLLSTSALWSADLQAGWYAEGWGPQVVQWIGGSPGLRSTGHFLTPPGVYGPFTLTGFGSADRRATVGSDAHGVGPDQSLALPMYGRVNISV